MYQQTNFCVYPPPHFLQKCSCFLLHFRLINLLPHFPFCLENLPSLLPTLSFVVPNFTLFQSLIFLQNYPKYYRIFPFPRKLFIVENFKMVNKFCCSNFLFSANFSLLDMIPSIQQQNVYQFFLHIFTHFFEI